ncbi:unnamed protein product, partial [Rotaria magnacalcarata]
AGCPVGEVHCLNPNGGRACVPKASMCNGVQDCLDGSDEDSSYCPIECTAEQIRCANSTGGVACVSKSSLCNGVW